MKQLDGKIFSKWTYFTHSVNARGEWFMTFNSLQRRREQWGSVSVFCRWLLQQRFDNDPLLFRRRICQGAAGWPSAHQSCSLLGGWSPWSAGTPWIWRRPRTRWTGPSGTGGRSWLRGTPSPISTNTTLTRTPDHQVGIVMYLKMNTMNYHLKFLQRISGFKVKKWLSFTFNRFDFFIFLYTCTFKYLDNLMAFLTFCYAISEYRRGKQTFPFSFNKLVSFLWWICYEKILSSLKEKTL